MEHTYRKNMNKQDIILQVVVVYLKVHGAIVTRASRKKEHNRQTKIRRERLLSRRIKILTIPRGGIKIASAGCEIIKKNTRKEL